MPVEVGIWKLAGSEARVRRVTFVPMPNERLLEQIIADDVAVVDSNLLLIGRQVLTSYGMYIDLLAMDPDGKLVVIELKRDKTPREVVAQALDYGSWVRQLGDEEIAAIYAEFRRKHHVTDAASSLDDAFKARFVVQEMPEVINDGHELLIVAGDLDASTERIVTYLSDEYGVAINVVFFRFFQDGDSQYLTRVWLIDPVELEAKAVERRAELPWNGEFYLSFGEGPDRRWEDARRLGYVAGGGGAWYSNTLRALEPGNRIWANVPGQGYVGVGVVTEAAQPITEFMVRNTQGVEIPIYEATTAAPPVDVPEEHLEFYVRVDWDKSLPLSEAIWEKGFFGNQNTVARPKAKKWVHTVDRLKARFGVQ